MKQLISVFTLFFAATTVFTLTSAFGQNSSVNPKYNIAAVEYEEITEAYLQHVASMEWEKSFAFLAEDVVFRLPDGDTDTRTSFKGLPEVKKFWNSYVEKSGNNQAVFTDFVHIPVQAVQKQDYVGTTGVFNLCYFSAKLSYGAETANVRMHWAFHFNEDKKIDGIYTYYDRTPIIEAAKKNFLSYQTRGNTQNDEMIIQIITLKSDLSEEELMATAKERAKKFREIPGLLQKYYTRLDQPGQYRGVYVWDSKKSMMAFKESELAAGIAKAYKVSEAPKIEIVDVLFQLRD